MSVPEDSLSILSRLADEQFARERDVAALEEQLRQAKGALAQVSEKDIPELMDSLELQTFTTRSGLRVEIREQLRYSVPKENKDASLDWLEGNDLGGSIKRHVGVDFGVKQVAEALALVSTLRAAGFEPVHERRIEPATLGKVLRESLAEGVPVPLELFGAWRERRSKITRKE